MTQQRDPAVRSSRRDERAHKEDALERQGPEPPENDSGPSPSVEEMDRYSDFAIENGEDGKE